MRYLMDGLRWMRPKQPLRMPSKVAISKARTRLGPEALRTLGKRIVRVLAEERTAGAWYRGWRLVLYDGTSLDGRTSGATPRSSACPARSRAGSVPEGRVTALLQIGTRVAFA